MLTNGNPITTVAHYKDAAKRHYQTCKILVEKLNDLQDDEHDNILQDDEHNNILANIYYLSGYMAECGVKYRCLEILDYTDGQDYRADKSTKWGELTIKTHLSFTTTKEKGQSEPILTHVNTRYTLPNYLQNLSGDTTTALTTTDDLKLKEMQEKWHPDVRYAYESTGLIFNATTSKVDILAFYEANEKLLKNDYLKIL